MLGGSVTVSQGPQGLSWHANESTTLLFSTGSVAQITAVKVDELLIIAAWLLLLWTGEISFAPQSQPGLEHLSRVTGAGGLWLLVPGFGLSHPSPLLPPVLLVDPDHLVHATIGAAPLWAVTGPDERAMLRLDGSLRSLVHSWPRPDEVASLA
jgi:hypothetical protein